LDSCRGTRDISPDCHQLFVTV